MSNEINETYSALLVAESDEELAAQEFADSTLSCECNWRRIESEEDDLHCSCMKSYRALCLRVVITEAVQARYNDLAFGSVGHHQECVKVSHTN